MSPRCSAARFAVALTAAALGSSACGSAATAPPTTTATTAPTTATTSATTTPTTSAPASTTLSTAPASTAPSPSTTTAAHAEAVVRSCRADATLVGRFGAGGPGVLAPRAVAFARDVLRPLEQTGADPDATYLSHVRRFVASVVSETAGGRPLTYPEVAANGDATAIMTYCNSHGG